MAEGLNRVILLGNLGADPELRMTGGGTAVLKLRLATSESYLDRNKQRQERTEWHRVVVWGRRAEGLGKVLGKGDRILVEGSLRTSSYDDKDGNKKYTTEVIANNIVLSGGGRPGGGGGNLVDRRQLEAPPKHKADAPASLRLVRLLLMPVAWFASPLRWQRQRAAPNSSCMPCGSWPRPHVSRRAA